MVIDLDSSLTRRFTLLRTSAGDPVSLDDLRTRFAEQRARGAENQISEEEEDMILETLGRMRGDNANKAAGFPSNARRNMNSLVSDSNERQSFRSTDTVMSTAPSSMASSPSGRFTKRYSNNLFGSGRFRDETYFRSVQAQKVGSQRSVHSIVPTESRSTEGNGSTYSDSMRPTTPEETTPTSSVQTSPEKMVQLDSSIALPTSAAELPVSAAEYRMSKTTPFNRASLALEEVITEIEEEAEDEIVMPRSVPPSRVSVVDQSLPPPDTVRTFVEILILCV